MKISKVISVCFSPCGETAHVVEELGLFIANTLHLEHDVIDFTLPNTRKNVYPAFLSH